MAVRPAGRGAWHPVGAGAAEAASAPRGEPHGGMFDAARQVLAGLVAHLRTRLELLGVELAQEKLRLGAALGFGLAALLCAVVALVLALVLVIALAWNTPWRLQVIAGLCVVSVGASGLLLGLARRRLVSGAVLFQASLRELRRDQHLLDAGPAGDAPVAAAGRAGVGGRASRAAPRPGVG